MRNREAPNFQRSRRTLPTMDHSCNDGSTNDGSSNSPSKKMRLSVDTWSEHNGNDIKLNEETHDPSVGEEEEPTEQDEVQEGNADEQKNEQPIPNHSEKQDVSRDMNDEDAVEEDPHAVKWKEAAEQIKKMPAESDSYNNILVFEGRMHDIEGAQTDLMQVYESVNQSLINLFDSTLESALNIQSQTNNEGSMLQKEFTTITKENCRRRPILLQQLDKKKRMITRFQNDMCYQKCSPADSEENDDDDAGEGKGTNGKEDQQSSKPSIGDGDAEPNWSEMLENEPSELSRANIKVFLDNIDTLQDADKQIQTAVDEARVCLVGSIENVRVVTEQTCNDIASEIEARRLEIESLMIDNEARRQRIAQRIQESQAHMSSLLNRVTCKPGVGEQGTNISVSSGCHTVLSALAPSISRQK